MAGTTTTTAIDGLTVVFLVLGGISMGSYPVPIKTPSVLEAGVHPIVFQCYKSFWVFLTGFIFLAFGAKGEYQFSWWGVASSAAWIPSGISTIIAVPKIGVGPTVALAAATASVLSFIVFWKVFDENIKEHSCGDGCTFVSAPIYLTCILLGMVVMVASSRTDKSRTTKRRSVSNGSSYHDVVDEEAGENAGGVCRDDDRIEEVRLVDSSNDSSIQHAAKDEPPLAFDDGKTRRTFLVGCIAAMATGVFGAIQYAIVNFGKWTEQKRAGCYNNGQECPSSLTEAFNVWGSWNVSFGIGAAAVNAIVLFGLCARLKTTGQPLPQFRTRKIFVPASVAGLCWCAGNVFYTAAVARGGNAVVYPAAMSVQLITAGLWSLFWYKLFASSKRNALFWTAGAAFTAFFVVKLALEKK